MLTAGIIGLPNSGKSTLFNALTKGNVLTGSFMFATTEPNVGVVTVNDERLDFLTEINKSRKTVPTAIQFVDVPALVKGASSGEGLGNQFLASIREVDAICHILRCFDDKNIPHVFNKIDPVSDAITVEFELLVSDLDVISKRLVKLHKKVLVEKIPSEKLEYETLVLIKKGLEEEIPIFMQNLSLEQKRATKGYNFLTAKPLMYIANLNEDDLKDFENNKYYLDLLNHAKTNNTIVVPLSVKLAEDLKDYSDEEKEQFLNELELTRYNIDEVITNAYELLGLETFFTAGEKETRAWTYKKGMTARDCAGVIHSDFYKGFIRAETVSFADLKSFGTHQKAKEAGKVRLEGRDYSVKDGDVLLFRFNV